MSPHSGLVAGSFDFRKRLMWACGRVDVLCVDGLCLIQTVWELLFSTKQALQSRGKSPNAEPRCLMAVEREESLCDTDCTLKRRVKEWKVEQRNTYMTHFWCVPVFRVMVMGVFLWWCLFFYFPLSSACQSHAFLCQFVCCCLHKTKKLQSQVAKWINVHINFGDSL